MSEAQVLLVDDAEAVDDAGGRLAALAAGVITILLGVFIVWGATRLRKVMVTRTTGAPHGV